MNLTPNDKSTRSINMKSDKLLKHTDISKRNEYSMTT